MLGRVRKSCAGFFNALRVDRDTERDTRSHNLFEAAAAYVSACAEDDQDRIDEAAGWVSPEALSFGVNELACRAVIALARERDESPGTVARSLLGLPAA
ncbi:hypothetical protein [Streptomyces resistomycificus]|uniref:Uncharacterized protein n=1 Tax=Streptomyces resistomycificus TaxID=67356 RepID=A0A0L8L8K4_9ACTN|nr:hypothetical protein [Streptomyces resistomycificus]KOG34528.1 hypothetical protein ADK37_18545 [Streptomyces resistomycificus]KUO00737.1 hypothetical protein AQJ84_06995 [Streptomyces resistomycificus]